MRGFAGQLRGFYAAGNEQDHKEICAGGKEADYVKHNSGIISYARSTRAESKPATFFMWYTHIDIKLGG